MHSSPASLLRFSRARSRSVKWELALFPYLTVNANWPVLFFVFFFTCLLAFKNLLDERFVTGRITNEPITFTFTDAPPSTAVSSTRNTARFQVLDYNMKKRQMILLVLNMQEFASLSAWRCRFLRINLCTKTFFHSVANGRTKAVNVRWQFNRLSELNRQACGSLSAKLCM